MPTKDKVRSILPGGKWHEVAMKWVADDAAVLQCIYEHQLNLGYEWDTIDDDSSLRPFSASSCGKPVLWRIKPQVLRYRVALWKASKNSPHYLTVIEQQDIADAHEQSPLFVRWLGDWVEAEL